jgi:hypothetical protein
VERFKAAVNVAIPTADTPEDNLTRTGQFFWARRIRIAVEQQLDSLVASPDPLARSFARRGQDAVLVICACREGEKAVAQTQEISAIFADLSKDARRTKSQQKPLLSSLLAPPPEPASLIEAHLYGALNKDKSSQLPNLDRLRSLRTLRAVYRYACTSCGDAAWQIVQRLTARGGIKPRNPNAQRSYPLAAPTAIRNLLPGPEQDTLLGDVIFQTGVAQSVALMKVAIDAGHQIHARVLSGIGYGHDPLQPDRNAKPHWMGPPPEEHSLIVFGYEGDSFVFSDPDASVSHHPEPGFGMLFYDFAANRLSTARTTSMLWVTPAPSGNHRGGDTDGDKRYQVVRLLPF